MSRLSTMLIIWFWAHLTASQIASILSRIVSSKISINSFDSWFVLKSILFLVCCREFAAPQISVLSSTFWIPGPRRWSLEYALKVSLVTSELHQWKSSFMGWPKFYQRGFMLSHVNRLEIFLMLHFRYFHCTRLPDLISKMPKLSNIFPRKSVNFAKNMG